MRISDRLKKLKPSATLAVNAKAQELKAQGRQIISLAVGEPDFPTPPHVVAAAKAALDAGHTRYTPVPGIPALRQAVAALYGRFYGAKAGSANVIVSNGGKQVLYNLLMALLNPGDQVLIPGPYWVSYPDMTLLADGEPVIVPAPAEKGFLLDPEDLEKAWTPRAKVLILNTPSNPTGRHYSQERLDALADWAEKKGVFVISDEVYDRLVYAPAQPSTLARRFEARPESYALVGALSKSFCMTGWRLGWALAHPDLVKAMNKIQGQSTSNVCSFVQHAAVAALEGPWDVVEEMKVSFQRRRDLALAVIRSWPGATCPKPDGAFYLFPVLDKFYDAEAPNSAALCTRILEQAGVALVPGSAFGDDRCVRFSYAVADEVLMTALSKVGKVLLGK